MRSGKLRDVLAVKIQTEKQDDYGERVNEYVHVNNHACNVMVISGSELLKAGIQLTSEYISILMRNTSDVVYERFIQWRGNIYSIESIKPSNRDRDLIVIATRGIS